MSARSAVAQQHGADEAMLTAVSERRDDDFTDEQRAALALADVFLGAPASMPDAVRQQVAEHLSPEQVVETVLKLSGFCSDKVMVALGLDLEEIRPFPI